MEISASRLEILKKIDEYERLGIFDRDVENDPPARPLFAGEVDFMRKKLFSRLKTAFANRTAKRYFDNCLKKGLFVIKEVRGEENFIAVKDSGLIVTANHFNPFDNYAVYKALLPHLGRKKLYKVIREGNYTGFPGLFGFFFRNCDTLPIPSRTSVLREMTVAVDELLKKGEKILIYPEQSMWWNYKKPKPLKIGAYHFAAKAGVPVLPIFITLEDTDKLDPDGYPVQAYTVHILPAICPDKNAGVRAAANKMCEENYAVWKEIYESVYGVPLTYTTEGAEVRPCST